MPNLGMFPQVGALLASAAVTTTGTSSATSIPWCESYKFMLDVATMAGTTLSLDVFLCTSDDGGTTYYEFLHFAQVTTSGQGSYVNLKPFQGAGEASTNGALPNLTQGVDGATGSTVVAANGPFDPRYMKVRYITNAGTTSATFGVRFIGVPPANAV